MLVRRLFLGYRRIGGGREGKERERKTATEFWRVKAITLPRRGALTVAELVLSDVKFLQVRLGVELRPRQIFHGVATLGWGLV